MFPPNTSFARGYMLKRANEKILKEWILIHLDKKVKIVFIQHKGKHGYIDDER